MIFQYSITTKKEEQFVNITEDVIYAIEESNIKSGICVVFCPHTTAGITINENADPNVVNDMIFGLDKAFPDRPEFRHAEGNSHAHLKSSCIGVEKTIIIENGKPVLGTWQGIYFCEFDGPRVRHFFVQCMGE